MSDGDYKFDMHGFDKDIRETINEYPGTAEKYLRKTGNKLWRMAKKATPVGPGMYRGRKTKHMKDMWRHTVVGTSGTELEYQLRSTAPHFHLVERGHQMVTPSGKYPANGHGFVQGTHFFEKTEMEWEASGDMEKQFEKLVDDLKKKVEE